MHSDLSGIVDISKRSTDEPELLSGNPDSVFDDIELTAFWNGYCKTELCERPHGEVCFCGFSCYCILWRPLLGVCREHVYKLLVNVT